MSEDSKQKEVSTEEAVEALTDYDVGLERAESMKGLFEEEGADMSLMKSFEVKARIFLTRKEYKTSFFRSMKFFKKFYRLKYHRIYGEFLGFRQSNIEAFIEGEKPFWIPGNDSVNEGLRSEQLAEKYGSDFSEDDLKAFEALYFGLLEDSKRRFYEGIEEMEERKEILEESSFDAGKIIEERNFR